jgi:hypothetical protein
VGRDGNIHRRVKFESQSGAWGEMEASVSSPEA